eukprot:364698-Chlamydomonas_euryale.AAC.4
MLSSPATRTAAVRQHSVYQRLFGPGQSEAQMAHKAGVVAPLHSGLAYVPTAVWICPIRSTDGTQGWGGCSSAQRPCSEAQMAHKAGVVAPLHSGLAIVPTAVWMCPIRSTDGIQGWGGPSQSNPSTPWLEVDTSVGRTLSHV